MGRRERSAEFEVAGQGLHSFTDSLGGILTAAQISAGNLNKAANASLSRG